MPITKAQIKKVEKFLQEQLEKEKDYQYIFNSKEELEEARKAGRVDESKDSVCIILDI